MAEAIAASTTSANEPVVTNGASPAMTIAPDGGGPAGSTVVTEEIGHHTLVAAMRPISGSSCEAPAIDREGILPDAFARACAEVGDVAALFVHPDAATRHRR